LSFSTVWAEENSLAPDLQLTDKALQSIQAGKVFMDATPTGKEHVERIHAALLVDAPASLLFNIITDYDHLHEFMPHLERTEVLESSETGAVVNYFLSLPFGVAKRYRLRLFYETQEAYLKMSWQLAEWDGLEPDQTINATEGYWLLKPMKKQDKTMVYYYTKTDPGEVPFGLGWIVDYLSDTTIVQLLKKTRQRSEKKWKNQNKPLH